jgi:hypothetical protein
MARKNKDFKMPSSGIVPDPLASPEEKATEEYGLQYGKLIEYEWFYIKSGNTLSNYYDKRDKFDKLRRYARGEQSTDIYKKLLTDGTDGESYTNYDWRPIQILPKFIKLVVDRMLERLYEVDAQAVDTISQGLRDEYKTILEKNMISMPMLQDAKNLLGIDLMPTHTEVPETSEELELHMKLKFKTGVEAAMEQAIKYTFEINEYDEELRRCIKDLVEVGVGCLFHTTDPTKGVTVERKDPADMVWSYPTSPNFKNVNYYGYVERMTIAELQRISGKRFDKEQLESFSNVSNEWQGYNRISDQLWYRGEDLPSHMVDVLFFTFKTTDRIKYKKKYQRGGGYSIKKRESNFEKPKSIKEKEQSQGYEEFDVLEDMIDVWYEGALVLGTEYLFSYRKCENMIRPEGLIHRRALPNYVVYAPELYQGRIQSLVDRTINTIDILQQEWIKIQQFIAKAKPNGIYIDIDGLQEADLGNGNTFTPLDLIRFYNETGNLIGTSRLSDGGFNPGSTPIKELNNGGATGLDQLMNSYNFHFNILRDVMGISAGADATLPHPDTALGVQQNVQATSNTATRYVLHSALKMTQYTATGISLRLKDIFKYSNLKDAYVNAIGKVNVDVLEPLKKLHLSDFGISIKLKPSAEDKQLLEANIQAEIAQGGLSVTDAIDIRKITNTTYANEMIKIRKEKRLKEQQQRELEKINAQTEGNVKAAQASGEAKQQELQMQMQLEQMRINLKGEQDRMLVKTELDAKKELMQLEYNYKMGIETAAIANKNDMEREKEDRKDKRTEIQATQQSKMIDQREKKSEPIDFKSAHSSVTGDLGIDDFN